MKLSQLLKYSEKENQRFISGSKESEINYLKFHYKRFKILFSIIKSQPPGKLLDIGTTPFTYHINENTNHQVFTLDYNDLLKDRSEKNGVQFSCGDLGKDILPYEKDFFNTIIFAEVFEHIHKDPVKILKLLFRILKPGGVLILGTPNLASLANRLKLLFNKAILDYPTWEDEVHGHDRIFVKNELKSYLIKSGFSIQRIKYSSCVDFIGSNEDSKMKRVLKDLFRIVSFPLRLIFPSLNGTLIITATKNYNHGI